MSRHGSSEDPLGTAVALVLGVLVGIALAAPALPETLRIGGASVDSIGAALIAGALAVVLLPIGIIALYQAFALIDR